MLLIAMTFKTCLDTMLTEKIEEKKDLACMDIVIWPGLSCLQFSLEKFVGVFFPLKLIFPLLLKVYSSFFFPSFFPIYKDAEIPAFFSSHSNALKTGYSFLFFWAQGKAAASSLAGFPPLWSAPTCDTGQSAREFLSSPMRQRGKH